MYADTMKVFLSSFHLWCNLNLMQLNFKICKYIRFVRKNPIHANYAFDGYELELVDNFLDLRVLFDPKRNFIPHITMTPNEARSALDFIKRWVKEFKDPYVTNSLYISLVRPILAYGSVVWNVLCLGIVEMF